MNLKQHQLIELHKILSKQFDEGELRIFCFNLEVDYDDLPGEGKVNKARELIGYFDRRNQLSKLIYAIQQDRPDIHLSENEYSTNSIPFKSTANRFNWSIASMVSIIAGGLITVLWMIKEPGFEPLLAIVLGLAAAGSLEKLKIPIRFDIILAVIIGVISIIGIVYLSTRSPENHVPIIHNLIISRETVNPGEKIMIIVEAIDEDDDPLSYIWGAKRGTVPSGNSGPTIEYIAPINPGTGLDVVEVTVTDGKGGNITQEVTIAIESQN